VPGIEWAVPGIGWGGIACVGVVWVAVAWAAIACVAVGIGSLYQGAGAVSEAVAAPGAGTTTGPRMSLLRNAHHDRGAEARIHVLSCGDTSSAKGCESCSHNHLEDRCGVVRLHYNEIK
jgi:hypothetical protein